jgi:hypothetical protein
LIVARDGMNLLAMVKKGTAPAPAGKPSALLDTRVIYCGDCLEQLEKLPPPCVDLSRGGIDPPFNSNRNSASARAQTNGRRQGARKGEQPRRTA